MLSIGPLYSTTLSPPKHKSREGNLLLFRSLGFFGGVLVSTDIWVRFFGFVFRDFGNVDG
jgi:hypothetical protein